MKALITDVDEVGFFLFEVSTKKDEFILNDGIADEGRRPSIRDFRQLRRTSTCPPDQSKAKHLRSGSGDQRPGRTVNAAPFKVIGESFECVKMELFPKQPRRDASSRKLDVWVGTWVLHGNSNTDRTRRGQRRTKTRFRRSAIFCFKEIATKPLTRMSATTNRDIMYVLMCDAPVSWC